jgi:hypothetical protein
MSLIYCYFYARASSTYDQFLILEVVYLQTSCKIVAFRGKNCWHIRQSNFFLENYDCVATDKQVDATGISTVSFTGSFLQILRSLQRSNLPIQPSFRPNYVLCFSYQSRSRSWLWFIPLSDLEIGLPAGVTGRQGMLTSPRHLVPPLVYSNVRVCPILWFVFPTGLLISMTVRYLCPYKQGKKENCANSRKRGSMCLISWQMYQFEIADQMTTTFCLFIKFFCSLC